MYSLQLTITRKEWLRNPEARWNAGLEHAGLQFRQHLQRSAYPPMNPGQTYVRTGTLADKAGFRIEEPGRVMVFGSTDYLQWLLIPARTVQNWAGKKDELTDAMKQGFVDGIKNYEG